MYTMSFEISAFLLSLLCFAYCLTAKRRQYIPPKGIQNRVFDQHFQFLMMLAMNMFSSISSVIGVYLAGINADGITFWQYFFHALYFIFHTTLSLAFGLYIMSVTGANLKKYKVLYVLFFIPYFIAEILILTNQWTGWCFYMDPSLGYKRGPLMVLLYALGGFYVVVGFVSFFKRVKTITRGDSIAVGVFIIIASLGIIVQAVKSDLLVELFSESLACLVIMMVLEEKAGHIDPATGLLNRFAFSDKMKRQLANDQSFDLVMIKVLGINGLVKRFNERTADAFLMQFASFLSRNDGEGVSYSYRRGEFMVIFKNPHDAASAFARHVVERFDSIWKLGRNDIYMDVTAAVINIPNDIESYDEFEDLMAAFEAYQKEQKKPYLIPQSEIHTMVQTRYYESELRKAVANKELEIYLQPIYDLKRQRTKSAEALLRIPVEPFNHVSPEIYIPIAEKSGLIQDIGLFVFEEVCRIMADPIINVLGIQYIELNLSTYQFLNANLVEEFEAIRKKYNVLSSKLNLEITETGGALNKDEILSALNRFKELGYTLSLDDFGTGYSNFVRMVRCKFENIKIDKSILWDIAKEENGYETLKSLTDFIKLQGSAIIQEGVESADQLDLVKQCGCDYVQGFYFSRALPVGDFYAYLEQEAAR